MDTTRTVVALTVGLIVLVTAASGTPLFSLPEGGFGADSPGQGTATVTVVSVPDRVTVEAGRQGGNVYYLRVPDAEVDVVDLRGNPILDYSVDIQALGFKRSSVHLLGSAGEGRLSVSLSETTLDPGQFEREAYDARIELVVRGSEGGRTIYAGNATVEVVE